MGNYLTARAALEATRKMHEKAHAAAVAAPGDKDKAKAARDLAASVTAAYVAAIAAAAGEPSLAAKRDALIEAKVIHHEKYEKKTVETEDKPADPPASEEPEEAAPETAPSEEEEPSSSAAAAKGKAPRMGKKAESEDEEEKALAAGYARASGSYQRAMAGAGIDAYGAVYGPKALLAACQKALGTTSIRETFGALRGLPEKLAASSELAARVEGLEKNDRKSRVNALVAQAKAEGRTRGKEHRAELRALGMRLGTAELRGVIKMLVPVRTTAQGFHEANEEGAEDGGGQFAAGVSDEDIKAMTHGMSAEQAAEFTKDFKARLAAQNKPPRV